MSFVRPDQVILHHFLCFLGRWERSGDWRSGSIAKSNSGVYFWTNVGKTTTAPSHPPNSLETLIEGRQEALGPGGANTVGGACGCMEREAGAR